MQFVRWSSGEFCRKALISLSVLMLLVPVAAVAQETLQPSSGPDTQTAPSASVVKLLIGPGDELEVSFYGVSDLNQKTRVNGNGEINLALVGSVPVAGMTAEEARTVIEASYVQGGYLKSPHITVFVKEYRTQNITITGEVTKPGVYQTVTSRRLLDLIVTAGGLTERAGRTVVVTHSNDREKPLVVTISEDPAQSAENNVELLPGDTVVVSRAGVVYVIGEVNRAGGFVMEHQSSMTVSQAIAKAAGPTRLASLNNTRVIRRTATGLENLDLPLKKILAAEAPDVALQAEDIVFVPGSKGKMAMERGSSSILSIITGLAIYRF